MLTQNQIGIIINAMKPFNPIKIGVFGSVAKNEATDNSDIDILYDFKDTIGLFKLIRLQQELQEKLNKKVDLVSEKYINPKLKPHILKDLKIIYDV
ncbi:MAG TPA: nucleotidyltransferase family protein [Flavobacteriaceae bacterium]|nr:nucleotidyltransferase family protein [Flavobacteriaceae bacterium]